MSVLMYVQHTRWKRSTLIEETLRKLATGKPIYPDTFIKTLEELSKNQETVKVVLQVPKGIHGLVTKLAAVEGSKPDEWYVDAIKKDVEVMLGDAHEVFDVQRLVRTNGLQGIVTSVKELM